MFSDIITDSKDVLSSPYNKERYELYPVKYNIFTKANNPAWKEPAVGCGDCLLFTSSTYIA